MSEDDWETHSIRRRKQRFQRKILSGEEVSFDDCYNFLSTEPEYRVIYGEYKREKDTLEKKHQEGEISYRMYQSGLGELKKNYKGRLEAISVGASSANNAIVSAQLFRNLELNKEYGRGAISHEEQILQERIDGLYFEMKSYCPSRELIESRVTTIEEMTAKLRTGVLTFMKPKSRQVVMKKVDVNHELIQKAETALRYHRDNEGKLRYLEDRHRGPCFIATAVYGTDSCEELNILRDFRDERLETNPIGNLFVKSYYMISPPIADFIRSKPYFRRAVKDLLITPSVNLSKRVLKSGYSIEK